MKCDICGKQVTGEELYQGEKWQINGAVLGEYISVTGHKTCCEAVNSIVVIPNRFRLMEADMKPAVTPVTAGFIL
ncbi:MAG: hypothetical protein ABIB79_03435 [archaeon]